jgi:dihydroorotate dehydrogenase electron transfer subunit
MRDVPDFRAVTVVEAVEETPSVTTLVFDRALAFEPGQFVMVWVPGVDEVPMALSSRNSISVQLVGEATAALSSMRTGDRLGLRGPYGTGFPPCGSALVVAGGIGAAPLLPLAEAGRAATVLLGARTAGELAFRDRFAAAADLRLATDDGSAGHHGYVADLLGEVDLAAYDAICVCGPEPMMAAVRDRLAAAGALERSFFSLHRYMKCGVGVCGSCVIDPDGLCVCRDGPVFPGPVLAGSELGRHTRDACGRQIPLGPSR